MSGIFGFFNNEDIEAIRYLQYGLYGVQHRGQAEVGIATIDNDRINYLVGEGLVGENFSNKVLRKFNGNKAMGYVKYAFRFEEENPMPFISKKNGMSSLMVIDGKIISNISYEKLREKIQGNKEELKKYLSNIKGAFSLGYMDNEKIVAIRDPYGVKPLSVGVNDSGYVISSETCAIDSIGYKLLKDLEPGEIFIGTNSDYEFIKYSNEESKLCLFEMVYIARPDSYIDGVSVYRARYNSGQVLYEENKTEADIVVGAPDSGIIAALGYSYASKIPYMEGIVKNRYIGRTFIESDQENREKSVNIKLNPIIENVKDKDIILVDDSIVRGTTTKRLIKMLKDSGARKVHLRIASPPVVNKDDLSIDIPSEENLISRSKSFEEVAREIQADSLYHLSLQGLRDCCGNKGYYEKYFA
ncbi:amidophosphoribosyltransferase [Miniphocaeibacter halophilus]|uniref:Amidophosphoribosyltransferase n=1 Tax=Miniphocaeibacter halophilus TaxID=2931922 RepID=A0AC61MRP0_9FIRM|nr:amidophosphoribosyltransferase [Miniphocaeibacter halophilus]QQK07993.1 amidophosphoribosyltransferase [Miniphocaeibacter halophilus]